MEEARRVVLRDQAAVVKRALATATEQTQRETRRHRILLLLALFLLGGIWRFTMGSSLTSHTLWQEMQERDVPGLRPVEAPMAERRLNTGNSSET